MGGQGCRPRQPASTRGSTWQVATVPERAWPALWAAGGGRRRTARGKSAVAGGFGHELTIIARFALLYSPWPLSIMLFMVGVSIRSYRRERQPSSVADAAYHQH